MIFRARPNYVRLAATIESMQLKQFNQLGLAEPVLHAVSEEGYSNPTPIQAAVIPALLNQQDVLGIAQTGTGKTAAFVLPLLHRLVSQKNRPAGKTCQALILAPTRELAAQIADSIRIYGRNIRHSRAIVVGGVKPKPQISALARGVDIVIATPGRLLDHMSTGALRLDSTTTIVLDEADQMMDLGFLPAIRKIMAKTPRNRQTVLLSATMPKQIRKLAHDFLTDPLEVAVTPVSTPIERIDQTVMHVDKAAKCSVLADLLGEGCVERAIVFTRTKRGADRVHRYLEKAGLSAAAIHGNKSQGQRQRTLAAFRNGGVKILVATDIAARGIDIDGVSHVVNFELPEVPEAYVHRIGRTARAGNSGIAISLCDAGERKSLRSIERLIGNSIIRREGGDRHQAAPVNGQPDASGANGTPNEARKRFGPKRRGKSGAGGKATNRPKGQHPKFHGKGRPGQRRRAGSSNQDHAAAAAS